MFTISRLTLMLLALTWVFVACNDDVSDDLSGDDTSTGSDSATGKPNPGGTDVDTEQGDKPTDNDTGTGASETTDDVDSSTGTGTGVEVTTDDSETPVDSGSETAAGTDDSDTQVVDTTATDTGSDTTVDTVDTETQDTETDTLPECYGQKMCDAGVLTLCGETGWVAYRDCAAEGFVCEEFMGNAALCVVEETVATSLQLTAVSQLPIPPAGVRVVFSVAKDNGMPASGLAPEDFTIINNDTNLPFSEGGGEPAIGESEGVDFYTILTLDMSDSMFTPEGNGAAADAVAAAKSFIQKHVVGRTGANSHMVAIYAFGSTAQSELVAGFTDDAATLNTALDELLVSGSRGGTNLYGAYTAALDIIRATETADSTVRLSMVLLSDGLHESGNKDEMRADALESLAIGDVDVYALGMPGEYDEAELSELASGAFYFYSKDDGATVSQKFDLIGDTLAYMTGGNYVVGVCSPLETDSSFTITATQGELTGSLIVEYSAEVEGWTGDVSQCNEAEIADPCIYQECGASAVLPGFECGGCAGATEQCDESGMCIDDCENLFCGLSPTWLFSCGTCSDGYICSEQQTCELDNELRIEAECAIDMSFDTCDAAYPGSSSNPGNTADGVPRLAENNLVGYTNGDSWIAFANVDFTDLKSITIRYALSLGQDRADDEKGFELRVDTADGSLLGTIRTEDTGDWVNNFNDATYTLTNTNLNGTHTVYFVGILESTNNGNIDYVIFEYDR